MIWHLLRIENCPSDKIDLLSDELEEQGALSILLTDKNDNPIFEPSPGTTPLWPEVIIEAMYAEEKVASEMQVWLLKKYPDYLSSIHILPDQDWVRLSMENFKPLKFGEQLWICPPWHTPPEPNAINLILDPGLAFGTGSHATTSLCLNWLAKSKLEHKYVIDYGCGSGILALAALKLGAAGVQAVDIDPQALQATKSNALLNNIAPNQLILGMPDILSCRHDIIIANILLRPLLSLGERFNQLLKEEQGAKLVVSGLLKDQAELLIKTYQPYFDFIESQINGDWILLAFRRR